MGGLPVSPLSEIFGGSSSADLIVFLVYNHDRDFCVQDIADRMKVSKAKVSKMKEGLLMRRPTGHNLLLSLPCPRHPKARTRTKAARSL
jgi:hypothetical protein